MTRDYLIAYLTTQDCAPVYEYDFPGIAQMWKNEITADVCFVPYEDELSLTTYCHIFFELRVAPPAQHGYDSDFAVYESFREVELNQYIQAKDKGKSSEEQA